LLRLPISCCDIRILVACEGGNLHIPSRSVQANEFAYSAQMFGEVRKEFIPNSFIGGEGILVLSLISQLNKEKVDLNSIQTNLSGMSKYLRPESDIQITDLRLRAVAKEIKESLPVASRSNPVSYIEAVIYWIRQNIEYTLLPKAVISEVARTLKKLPADQRGDIYTVLADCFPGLPSDDLVEVSKMVKRKLPPDSHLVDEERLASWIMNEACDIWRIFQISWTHNGTSALQTLLDRSGKCVGINHLFIALARLGNIPAREINNGYLIDRSGGGRHAWSAVFLPPYGWVEVDATNAEGILKFRHNIHAYEFLFSLDNKLPPMAVREKGKLPDDAVVAGVESTICKLESKKGWIWERRKLRKDAEFLKQYLTK
jgi:hypothetical protein